MANQRTAFEREETRLLAGVDYLEILAGEYAVEHAIALAAAHAALAARGGPTAGVVRELERLQAGVMVATEQLEAHRAAGVDGVGAGDGAAGPWVMEQVVVPVVHGAVVAAADGGVVGAMEVGAEMVQQQQQQQEPGVGDAENVDPNAGTVVVVGGGDVVDDGSLSSQEKKRRRLGGDVPVAAGEVAVVLATASSSSSSTSSSGGSGAGGGGAGRR